MIFFNSGGGRFATRFSGGGGFGCLIFGILGLVAAYYILKGFFIVLYWAAPALFVLALIINWRAVTDTLKDWFKTLESNPVSGLLTAAIAVLAFPVFALYLAVTVLLVGLAIGWREAAVVAIVIPVTILLTMFASWIMGYTINRVSLFALIFSIGILVDDAIVVIENIARHWNMGDERSRPQAAIEAVAEVGNPTIVATLTVVAALQLQPAAAHAQDRFCQQLRTAAAQLLRAGRPQDEKLAAEPIEQLEVAALYALRRRRGPQYLGQHLGERHEVYKGTGAGGTKRILGRPIRQRFDA